MVLFISNHPSLLESFIRGNILGVSDRLLLLQTQNMNSDLVLQNPHTFSTAVSPKFIKMFHHGQDSRSCVLV